MAGGGMAGTPLGLIRTIVPLVLTRGQRSYIPFLMSHES